MATPDAELRVRIEAELASFANGLKKGESDTQKFGTTVDNILKKVEQQARRTGTSVGQSGGAASKSSADWTKFNRVIQDAPFGLIGIANNLQELIPNIGLASVGINLLLTAVQFAQIGFVNWTRGLTDNKKAVDNVKLSGEEYLNTLNQISKASLNGRQNAQAELTDLRLLYSQYTDNSRSLSDRKKAYQQLQDQYPAYFGNLKFEKEATNATSKAYESLTRTIIASAKSRAYADEIAKNGTQRLENEEKITNLTNSRLDTRNKLLALGTRVETENLLAKQEANILTSEQKKVLDEYLKLQSSDMKMRGEVASLILKNNDLKSKDLALEKQINIETAKGGSLIGDVGKEAKKSTESVSDLVKQLKAAKDAAYLNRVEALSGISKLPDEAIKKIGNAQKNETEKALKDGYKNALVALPGLIQNVDFVPEGFGRELYTPFDILKENIEYDFLPKLATGFENFFNDILERGKFSFGALGQAILKTFTSVLANEATQGLLGLLGGKTANGQKLGGGGLLAGIAGLIGTKAGAGAATATGVGATGGLLLPILGGIAAGGLIASLFKKKQPEPAPSFNSYSNTASNVSSDSFGGGTVVFQISGTNLIGVLNRAGAKLERYNGRP